MLVGGEEILPPLSNKALSNAFSPLNWVIYEVKGTNSQMVKFKAVLEERSRDLVELLVLHITKLDFSSFVITAFP
jgi:hypothetical protein